jgi:Fe-S-cluster containining protein
MTERRAPRSRSLRFECTVCGKCCTTHGEYAYVYVDDDEVLDLARFLELSPREFRRKYTFVDEDGWRQLAFSGDRCIFLDESGRCDVYEARPVQCRTFPFWPEMIRAGGWTPDAQARCEGLGRGRLWSSEEIEARMLEFIEASDEE